MQDYFEDGERQQCLAVSLSELEQVNKELSRLLARKEELTSMVIATLGHQHEGQRTYEYDQWKVEVKTPCVYSLNKRLYESGACHLPSEFNPVKESVSYTIDKRLCEQYMENAPEEVRDRLIDLIEKKPGKAIVSLKERVI